MYKKMVLLMILLIIGGCSINKKIIRKKDITEGVSEKDKKLFSFFGDKIYYIYKDISITEHGFYPYDKTKYLTNDKRFYLQRFINDVYAHKLQALKKGILVLKRQYPSLNLFDFNEKEIKRLIELPFKKQQKFILQILPEFYDRIPNLDEDLILFAKARICSNRSKEASGNRYIYSWKNNKCKLETIYASPNSNSSGSSSSSSSSNRPFNSMPSNASPGRGYYTPGVGYSY